MIPTYKHYNKQRRQQRHQHQLTEIPTDTPTPKPTHQFNNIEAYTSISRHTKWYANIKANIDTNRCANINGSTSSIHQHQSEQIHQHQRKHINQLIHQLIHQHQSEERHQHQRKHVNQQRYQQIYQNKANTYTSSNKKLYSHIDDNTTINRKTNWYPTLHSTAITSPTKLHSNPLRWHHIIPYITSWYNPLHSNNIASFPTSPNDAVHSTPTSPICSLSRMDSVINMLIKYIE